MRNNRLKTILLAGGILFITNIFGQKEIHRIEDTTRHRKAMISDMHLHKPEKDSSDKDANNRDDRNDRNISHQSHHLSMPSSFPSNLRPVAFMSRPSALDNPDAPISHHWGRGNSYYFWRNHLRAGMAILSPKDSISTGREPGKTGII